MLGGAEKQAVKGTLRGKMSLFTKDSSPGNTGCPLKVCSSWGFAERWLPVKGTSRDSPPQLSVIFYWFCCCFLFVGDSCQEWDCFGLQFRWSLRKSPESQDRGCFGHFNNPSPVVVTQLFWLSSPGSSWISVPSNTVRPGSGKSSMLCYPPCWIFLVSESQMTWAFLLWLCKISPGGLSLLRRLSSPVSPCRRTHLAWGLPQSFTTCFFPYLQGFHCLPVSIC